MAKMTDTNNCRYIHHEQNQPGAEIYIDSSGGILGGFDNLTGGTLSHEIANSPRCDAEVNPQKEKRSKLRPRQTLPT